MRFVWKLGVAVILLTQSGCSASWHLKRAIAKDPTINADTIVRVDTTIVTNERRVVDTLVITDTIVREIESNGARVRLQRIHDTIHVDVVCPPDTIRVVAEIPIERIIYKEAPPERGVWFQINAVMALLFAIIIASIVGRMIMK